MKEASPVPIKSYPNSNVNIYEKLASIPRDRADKITNAKTGGGRSLNAIHTSKNLAASEKHLLLVLANEMDFTGSFEYQYKPISINYIAEMMSVDRKTVMRIINGHKEKSGLVINGYLIKIEATITEQQNGYANNYCLTSKIFDEYMLSMIDGKSKIPGVPKCPTGMGQNVPRGWDTVGHNIPITPITPILNAAAQQTAAIDECLATKQKKCRPLSKKKMKTWAEKSHDEKMETVLHKSFDAHRRAVEQKRAEYLPYDDFPEILKLIIEGYGLEKVREFFDERKKQGCDIRAVEKKIRESVSQMTKKPAEFSKSTLSDENIHQAEEKINEQNENFTNKILTQIGTNMTYAHNLSKRDKIETVNIENFPLRLKKFYDSINSKFQQKALVREISAMGLDKFLQLRATAILKCSYEELFVESAANKPSFAQF